MNIRVPFIYEALIIKPRCRKPSLIVLRDFVDVTIKETSASALPVAIKVGDKALRWDGQSLWDFKYETVSDQPSRKVAIEEAKRNTEDGGISYKYSCASAAAPFKHFWDHASYEITMAAIHRVPFHGLKHHLDDDNVIDKADAVYRTWVDDNKEAVALLAQSIADDLLIVDGFIYTTMGEPRYEINTFGLGNNHGGTGMFITYHYNSNISKERYFSALEYEAACLRADKIATARGDLKSVPVRPNCKNSIEVLIKDAVQCAPNTEHGNGCEFTNNIEDGINAAGPIGGLMAAFSSPSSI